MEIENWQGRKVDPQTRDGWIKALLDKEAKGEIDHSAYACSGDSIVFLFRGSTSVEVFDCLIRRHGEKFYAAQSEQDQRVKALENVLRHAQRHLQRVSDDDEDVIAYDLVKQIDKALSE